MIAALIFLLVVAMMIATAARLIWLDARRRAVRPEATELGIDEQAEVPPFRRLGSVAADVVRQAERRRA